MSRPSKPPSDDDTPSDTATADAENLAEAERLAALPRDQQRKAIDLIRHPGEGMKKRDQAEAERRADALERLLRGLNRRKKV